MFFYLDYSRTPQSGTVKPARISADTEAGGQPNTLYKPVKQQYKQR